MPHIRQRYVTNLIEKAKLLSPIVGLLGHRQVGKTTVLELLANSYSTLDSKSLLDMANKFPEEFLVNHHSGFQAIDECQLAPALFPALKEWVRKKKQPGQFLLSGSVRFTSRKLIQESLTGRIVNFELLPLSVSEIAQLELPQTLKMIMTKLTIEKAASALLSIENSNKKKKESHYYYDRGGLPGVCFINDPRLRALQIKEQLLTLLDRDVRLVYPTSVPYLQILNLAQFMARHQGEPLNYTKAKVATGLSVSTIKKLLYAFEAVFLLRRLPIMGDLTGEIYYLEDQAEANFLADGQIDDHDQFIHFIYRNFRVQFYYKIGSNFREFSFFSRAKIHIPYAIEESGVKLGILPIQEILPSRQERSAASSFLKRFGNAKILFVNRGQKVKVINERSLLAPVDYFI